MAAVRDLRIGETTEAPAFRLHLLAPGDAAAYARPIMDLTNQAWHHRLGHAINPDAIDERTDPSNPENVQRVVDGLERKTNNAARYSVALEEENNDLLGFVRVETYKPRALFKQSYPNVTDLEVKPPREQHSVVGGALLYFGLSQHDPNNALSLYSEAVNADGNAWFEELGLEETGRRPDEPDVETDTITYVQFKLAKVGVSRVMSSLIGEYTPIRYQPHNGG